ncbi:hypothetical protein U3516DRAFT_660688 [Neocallimastix sp. 'constans']
MNIYLLFIIFTNILLVSGIIPIQECKDLINFLGKDTTNFDCCNFSYVVCDPSHSYITELELHLQEITGSMQNFMNLFPHLVHLNVGNNNFSGNLVIPDDTKLQTLYGYRNNFSGSLIIPENINLEILGVSENNFSGNFVIPQNSQLKEIYIYENNFSGDLIVPENSKLTKLDAHGNRFTGSLIIPDDCNVSNTNFKCYTNNNPSINFSLIGGNSVNGLDKCIIETPVNNKTINNGPDDDSGGEEESNHIVLYIILPIVFVVLLIGLFIFGYRRNAKNNKQNSKAVSTSNSINKRNSDSIMKEKKRENNGGESVINAENLKSLDITEGSANLHKRNIFPQPHSTINLIDEQSSKSTDNSMDDEEKEKEMTVDISQVILSLDSRDPKESLSEHKKLEGKMENIEIPTLDKIDHGSEEPDVIYQNNTITERNLPPPPSYFEAIGLTRYQNPNDFS